MSKDPLEPQPDDFRTVYQIAHHDTWWAKSQMWQVGAWGLGLIGAVVGLAQLLKTPRSLAGGWLLGLAAIAVQVAASGYTARLHLDILRNRRITDSIEQRRGELAAVTADFPHVRQAHPFKLRGAWFPIASNLLLSLGVGVAVNYLTAEPRLGAAAWFVTLVLGLTFLTLAVSKGAA